MNVTEKQKRILLDYMKENRDFARGRLRYSSENKKILDDIWFTVSNSLNAVANGPHKQPKEWQKTWRDWKSNVLKKCARNKSYAAGTGGGPPKIINLTDVDENLLEVIDSESAGLENIPEGGNFQRVARDISSRNKVPQGGFFNRSSSAGSSKRTAEGHPMGLAAHSVENKRIRTSVALHNRSPEVKNVVCEPLTSLIGSQSNEIDDPYELHFMAVEEESISSLKESNIEDDIVEREVIVQRQRTPVTTDVHRTQNKKPSNYNHQSRIQSNARTAIDLMREKMELLREQVTNKKQYQERMIQIEEEKLQIARENMEMKKEIAGYLKNIHEDFKNVLSNIDNNVTRLREDVEKIAPSYLEQEWSS